MSPVKIKPTTNQVPSQMVQIWFSSGFEDPIILPVWGTETMIKHWLSAASKECYSRPLSVHVALDAFFGTRGVGQPLNVSRRFLGYRTPVYAVAISRDYWKVGRGLPRTRIPLSLADFALTETLKIDCRDGAIAALPIRKRASQTA